ncbi:MAG: transporter [Verrucomicrobiota bacterium]
MQKHLSPVGHPLLLLLTLAATIVTASADIGLRFNREFTLTPASSETAGGGAATGEADSQAELAKKLNNPVASLISVPIQNNWDFGIGPADAMKYTANIQPVIPVSISEDWNVIVRTILPVIYAESPTGGSSTSGLGDTTQSFFLSPKNPTKSGWIWGAGPVFYWPTSTDDALGTGKVGAGPTAVLLKQEHGWTYGILANHIWSFAGQGDTPDINATFLQPFLSFTTKTYTTFTLNTESTYDWDNSQWTVPLNLMVAQLVKIGKMPVQFQIGGRYYAERPMNGPDWGLRFTVVFLFPK